MADYEAGVVRKLFDREDLSKPENRANQWLLASCCADAAFRAALLARFNLPSDAVLAPVQFGGCRPDLTVLLDGVPKAVIECEISGRDLPQEARFRDQVRLPQHWILGSHQRLGDVTWTEVRQLAEGRRSVASEQIKVALDLLIGAVKDIEGSRPSKAHWLKVPDELPEPFLSGEAFSPLRDLAAEDKIGAWTFAPGSASLRLLRPTVALRTRANGLGLAMTQVRERGTVVLPNADHLREKLAIGLGSWADRWADTITGIAPNAARAGRGARLDPNALAAHAGVLADLWSDLASRLRRWKS